MSQIKVGDLVQVVRRTDCGCNGTLGLVFVAGVESLYTDTACGECGKFRGPRWLIESGIQAGNGTT